MMTVSEKTFISISIGLLATLLSIVFTIGVSYQRLVSVEKEVGLLREDFNKYVIERGFNSMTTVKK